MTKALDKLKQLTTLTEGEFKELYSVFAPIMEEKMKHFTLKGHRRKYPLPRESKLSSLYGSRAKLLFILQYLKEHPCQVFMGEHCQMSQSKVSEWISYTLPVLRESLGRLCVLPKRGGTFSIPDNLDYILCDVTERQVNRNKDYEVQKMYFSGKKKAHTEKNLAFTDNTRYVHYLGETYEGGMHDKTLWDQVEIRPSDINILVDLGFLGADKEHDNVVIPYKSSKNKKLTVLQKQINKGISGVRVKVEHAFAGIKRLKIAKEKVNLKTGEIRDLVMLIATGLHNLRVTSRPVNIKP